MEKLIAEIEKATELARAKALASDRDEDWHHAMSLEHDLEKFRQCQAWIKKTGRSLGVMESTLKSLHETYPYSKPFEVLRLNFPDIYEEIVNGCVQSTTENK